MPQISHTATVGSRGFELSGTAVVSGGLLLVDDESIGSVLFVTGPPDSPGVAAAIKLERKKKERAPYAPQPKLFPIQDFEDIATDRDSEIFLLGSHNGKDGERRPDREFLLRGKWNLDIKNPTDSEIKVTGEQYHLLEGIAPGLEALGVEVGLSDTAVSDRVNIEGLAYHNGRLFVGLRSPLTASGNAILVTLESETAFGSPDRLEPTFQEIDLDGGGIRALDWDPKRESLLAVSGPAVDDGPTSAQVWHVDPDTGESTVWYTFTADIARKGPEGICRLPEKDGGQIVVVLDGEGSDGRSEMLLITE